MSSHRQIEANRRNSLLSTGPCTADGKVNSSRNSLKHGLTAQNALLPGEDKEIYDTLSQAMVEKFCPQGLVEAELVERVTSLMWRLRRVPYLETALFKSSIRYVGLLDSFDGSADNNIPEKLQESIGFILDHMLSKDHLGKINRYEAALANQLKFTILELRRLMDSRQHTDLSAEAISV